MAEKRIVPTAEVLRERKEKTPAKSPLAWLAGEVAPRLGMDPEQAVEFFNSMVMSPENMADVGMATGPIAGVSKPIKKTLRTTLTKGTPEGLPLQEAVRWITAVAGRHFPSSAPRTGGQLSSNIFINPDAESIARLAKYSDPAALARSVPVHESGHALVSKHFPFLTEHRMGGLANQARAATNEVLAAMFQSLRSAGDMTGTLGTFSRWVERMTGLSPGARADLMATAYTDPVKALEILADAGKLSPNQKRAILDNPFVRNFYDIVEKQVSKKRP